jgi:hypothetical protein
MSRLPNRSDRPPKIGRKISDGMLKTANASPATAASPPIWMMTSGRMGLRLNHCENDRKLTETTPRNCRV